MKTKNTVRLKRIPVDLTKYYPPLTEDRLLVKRDEIEEKTASGLYLPENVIEEKEDTTTRGTIVSMGYLTEKTKGYELFPGARVSFGKYTGVEFEWDQEEFLIIRADEIFAAWPVEKEKKES